MRYLVALILALSGCTSTPLKVGDCVAVRGAVGRVTMITDNYVVFESSHHGYIYDYELVLRVPDSWCVRGLKGD